MPRKVPKCLLKLTEANKNQVLLLPKGLDRTRKTKSDDMAAKNNRIPYVERDISWLYFNRRVLQEAISACGSSASSLPAMERIRSRTLKMQSSTEARPKITSSAKA